VFIIGKIDDKKRVTDFADDNERLVFAGDVANGGECVKMADLYIQPTRAGGGRSAFEAAYHGLPVVTTRYGDVWGTMGDEFTVEDYGEMLEKIAQYISDKDYYESMSKKSKKRADELEDMEGTFVDLFEKLNVQY
jgi:glycosyltransferase involved in cell wall biosynthesis